MFNFHKRQPICTALFILVLTSLCTLSAAPLKNQNRLTVPDSVSKLLLPAGLPSLDEMSGEWISMKDVANPPDVNNFHDMLIVGYDLTSFSFDVVINTFFGFSPSLDGHSMITDPETARPFRGTLTGLRYLDRIVKLSADETGVKVIPESESRTYYIDSRGGNDLSIGLSSETAWKSFDRINSITLLPGDKILLKKGSGFRGQLRPNGSGSIENPIIIDSYGSPGDETGAPDRPVIHAEGKFQSALYLYNAQCWEIRNLELTNTGESRSAGRAGIHIHLENFGEAKNIRLKNLLIHDVNGSLIKKQGGGQGILIQNEGDSIPSRFNGLIIEDCIIRQTERNGIIFECGFWKRDKWYPNLNVVIRNNVIEKVPGDGIVPIGCDGALIEYNRMKDCTRLLPDGEAAAGIWPWSCDNTIVQYNEVSDHKAPWDGQGFDSDWNCRNTIIQYNFSHDNEGGFLLICTPTDVKMPDNIGNDGTIVRYNLSVNDGLRNTGKHAGFSPVFHITGPVTNNQIYNNTIALFKKPSGVDTNIIKMDTWGGAWPVNSFFNNNIFFVTDSASYSLGKAINTNFENNLYFGKQSNQPDDRKALLADPMFVGSLETGADIKLQFRLLPGSPCIGSGIGIPSKGRYDISSQPLPLKNCAIGAFEYHDQAHRKSQ